MADQSARLEGYSAALWTRLGSRRRQSRLHSKDRDPGWIRDVLSTLRHLRPAYRGTLQRHRAAAICGHESGFLSFYSFDFLAGQLPFATTCRTTERSSARTV